jgi:hypothetical protein
VGDAKSMGRRGAYVADTIGCRKNRPAATAMKVR